MSGNAAKDLEQWIPRLISVWRSRQKARRGGEGDTLNREELKTVARGVKTLSHGLTRERELVGAKYMDDPALLGAYLLFYWPVSYAQAREVLGELERPKDALDLGSGPGPMGFAAMDAGARLVTCADRSKPALELAKALAVEAGVGISTREWSPEKPLPEGQFDVITMGHVVNELFGGKPNAIELRAQLLEKVLGQVKPGGSLVVLEPALRDTSRELLKVRDVMVRAGWSVRAPCLFQGDCPALVKESDWCHAERLWQRPALVEAIAREAGLHKEALKMSYLAIAPRGEGWQLLPEGRLFRIVSEPLEGKGRLRYVGCGPEGRVGLAMQEKHLSPDNERFAKLKRGEVIRIEGTEPRGDGQALVEGSKVQTVAWPGSPLSKK